MYDFRGFPSIAILSPGGAKLTQPRGRNAKSFQQAYDEAAQKMKKDVSSIEEQEKAIEKKFKKDAEQAQITAKKKAAFEKNLAKTKTKAEKGDQQAKDDMAIHKAMEAYDNIRSQAQYSEWKKSLLSLFKEDKKTTLQKHTFIFYHFVLYSCIENKNKEDVKKCWKKFKKAYEVEKKLNPNNGAELDKAFSKAKEKASEVTPVK